MCNPRNAAHWSLTWKDCKYRKQDNIKQVWHQCKNSAIGIRKWIAPKFHQAILEVTPAGFQFLSHIPLSLDCSWSSFFCLCMHKYYNCELFVVFCSMSAAFSYHKYASFTGSLHFKHTATALMIVNNTWDKDSNTGWQLP